MQTVWYNPEFDDLKVILIVMGRVCDVSKQENPEGWFYVGPL